MANEFIIKNGFHSNGDSEVTGSLKVTTDVTASFFTGSFVGDGTGLTGVTSTLPAATSTTLGGIKLASATAQTIVTESVSAAAGRTYGLQVNPDGQGVINVPWTDTAYNLPSATATTLGGIKLFSATTQNIAATAVSATSDRTYGLQVNASGQAVVNVPWEGSTTDTGSLLTTASVSLNTITFTKGDASTFNITVDTGSGGGGAAFPYTGSAEITGSLGITGSLNIYKSGSTVFSIEGSQGQLFTVTDELSGSLFSVNDISGIPILEVFSDDTVKIGTYNAEAIIVSGSSAIITGSFTGSFVGDGVGLTNISGSSLYNNLRTYKLELGASSTSIITTGQKGLKTVPYLGTIVGWKLISDTSTTTVIDVWKRNNAIPTITDSITAGAKPTLSAAQLTTSTTLTGWTTSVSTDDVFTINVDSNDSATYLALELDILLT